MADPLSITASLLAITTAAIQSVKSLCETVKRYRDRDKTLRRLQDELYDLTKILESLTQATKPNDSVLALLESPIKRCTQTCHDFELAMKGFTTKTKMNIVDWTKMEFMRGDINEFIEMIAGYKSTISVGLGTVTMHTSKVSHKVLLEYNEMIKDTAYNLELHLQRIDEKMTQLTKQNPAVPDISGNLKDEKDVTKQCLRICEQARSYLQNLSIEASSSYNALRTPTQDHMYEAQIQMHQTLQDTRDSFTKTSNHLLRRLESITQGQGSSKDDERLRLQADIMTSKQCLDVCNMASEISRQKIYRVGEVIADGDSDQVVVNTLADLFDVGKAMSKDKSAQLVGSMTDESLQHLAEKRYNSRFGVLDHTLTNESRSSFQVPIREKASTQGAVRGQDPEVRQNKPSSNEMRKRKPGEETTG